MRRPRLGGATFCVLCCSSGLSSAGLANEGLGVDDLFGLVQRSKLGRRVDAGSKDVIYFMHIPRTSGTSFALDASRLIWGLRMESKEGCYAWRERIPGATRVATMVREPTAHVLSQHAYCSEGSIAWQAKVPGFREWVDAWTGLQANGTVVGDFSAGGHDQLHHQRFVTWTSLPFKCYNPANLQSQHFTCERPFRYPARPDLGLALRNLRSAWFVGVAEAYLESLCLFHAKLEGTLLPFCDCEDPEQRGAFAPTHVSRRPAADHLGPRSPGDEERAAAQSAVEGLTSADRALYAAAVRRFLAEVRAAEEDFGVRILCGERAALLEAAAGKAA
mmetsp:Transcript_92015/g.269202  ORF Transcript_92015/g.269202 Transcript_92015/m.269202 type:complete len:332 (+) Transcript_92015:85-1080(+)